MSSIRSSFNVTAPEVTVKSVESKLATPRLDVVAISAATVYVPAVSSYVRSIPSPSCKVKLTES